MEILDSAVRHPLSQNILSYFLQKFWLPFGLQGWATAVSFRIQFGLQCWGAAISPQRHVKMLTKSRILQLVFLFAVYSSCRYKSTIPLTLPLVSFLYKLYAAYCTAWGVGLCGKGFVKCVVMLWDFLLPLDCTATASKGDTRKHLTWPLSHPDDPECICRGYSFACD